MSEDMDNERMERAVHQEGGTPPVPGEPVPKTAESGPPKHTRRKFLTMLGGGAVLATAAAVGIKLGSGGGESAQGDPDESPGAIVDPTSTPEPTKTPTPRPTNTTVPLQETTPFPTPTAEPTNTPLPTETPTPEPTKEPDPPSPEVQSILDKAPYEIGWSGQFGDVVLAVTKDMQDRTECYYSATGMMKDCSSMDEVYLNTEDFPDAEEKLNLGVKFGLYKAWQNSENSTEIGFPQFIADLDSGMDHSFTIKGYPDGENPIFAEDVVVNPSKPVSVVWLGQPGSSPDHDGTFITVSSGFEYGYRVIDGHLIIQIFDITAGQINNDSEINLFPSKSGSSIDVFLGLVLINNTKISNALENQSRYPLSLTDSGNIMTQGEEIAEFIIPIREETGWNGILRVK